MDSDVYQCVGIACGTTPDGQELVGLMFPTGAPPVIETEEPEFDTKYMTLPAAKALLIDLRDAIEQCEKHQGQ